MREGGSEGGRSGGQTSRWAVKHFRSIYCMYFEGYLLFSTSLSNKFS